LRAPGYAQGMPSLLSKVARFAQSPQGRQLTEKARRAAKDPKNRARIEQARARLAKRNSG
jgi:hypothetical protein